MAVEGTTAEVVLGQEVVDMMVGVQKVVAGWGLAVEMAVSMAKVAGQ